MDGLIQTDGEDFVVSPQLIGLFLTHRVPKALKNDTTETTCLYHLIAFWRGKGGVWKPQRQKTALFVFKMTPTVANREVIYNSLLRKGANLAQTPTSSFVVILF